MWELLFVLLMQNGADPCFGKVDLVDSVIVNTIDSSYVLTGEELRVTVDSLCSWWYSPARGDVVRIVLKDPVGGLTTDEDPDAETDR